MCMLDMIYLCFFLKHDLDVFLFLLWAKQEMWIQSLGQEDLLEKAMATHFNILACKMCGQRSLEGYSPWGSKRFRHNLVIKQQQLTTLTMIWW